MVKQITITNGKGKQISVEKYDYVCSYGFDHGYEYAVVRLNGKEGFIDENGKEICPPKYDMVELFIKNGRPIRVKLNGKYGLINTNGEEICPIKYSRIDPFDDNEEAFAKSGKNMFYLDKNGKETPIRNLVSE